MIKYILIAFFFLACNTTPGKNGIAAQQLPTDMPDTIRSRPATYDAQPVLFEAAFMKGSIRKVKDVVIPMYGVTIGKIKIPSGRIIACDPMHIDEYGKPFTQVFPRGEFPVQLSIAKLGDEETIVFARIHFSDAPVEKWEFALLEGQSQIPLGREKIHGYAVDAGVAVFIDDAANKALDRNNVTETDRGIYPEMERHQHNGWRYSMYNFGDHNLAAFSAGLGDGYYATYIGFDAQGKPCRLLTDFNFFDWRSK